MINTTDAEFCATLVEGYKQDAVKRNVLNAGDDELLETAIYELRRMPPVNLSVYAAGVVCGVIDSYLKRNKHQCSIPRYMLEMMQSIRQRIREIEHSTIH